MIYYDMAATMEDPETTVISSVHARDEMLETCGKWSVDSCPTFKFQYWLVVGPPL